MSLHVLHADLKLDNILVDVDHSPPLLRIADFGISAGIWHPGALGDPSFIPEDHRVPPELAVFDGYRWKTNENGDVRLSLDIWMLGCLLWQLITGIIVEGQSDADFYFVQRVHAGGSALRLALEQANHIHPTIRDLTMSKMSWDEAQRPVADEMLILLRLTSMSSSKASGRHTGNKKGI